MLAIAAEPPASGIWDASLAGWSAPVLLAAGGLLLLLAAAGLTALLAARRRRRGLSRVPGLPELAALERREFDLLLAEAFRRRGYLVQETRIGRGRADGFDLVLRRQRRVLLVQSRHWRARRVSAASLRALWDLARHHRVDGIRVLCLGAFTVQARAFAADRPIEHIDGAALMALVREVRTEDEARSRPDPLPALLPAAGHPQSGPPVCTHCHLPMVLRREQASHRPFWGCVRFPDCDGGHPA